jgi:hypothetical protein
MTNEQPRLTIDKRSPALWAVTFANPPINLIDPAMIGELQQGLTTAATDGRLAVIVFVRTNNSAASLPVSPSGSPASKYVRFARSKPL